MNIDINNYRSVIDEINNAMTKSEKVEIINKYGLNCPPKLKDMGRRCMISSERIERAVEAI